MKNEMRPFLVCAFIVLICGIRGELRIVLSLDKNLEGCVDGSAVLVGIQDMRQNRFFKDITISWKVFDAGTWRLVMKEYFEVLDSFKPHLFISIANYNLALVTAASDTAYLSVGPGSDLLVAIPKMFPTFFTTAYGLEFLGNVLMELMNRYKWTRAAVLYSFDTLHRYRALELKKFMALNKFKYNLYFVLPGLIEDKGSYEFLEATIKIMLSYLKLRATFFILLMDMKDLISVLTIADQLNMLDGTFAFLTYGAAEIDFSGQNASYYYYLNGVLTVDQMDPVETDSRFVDRLRAAFNDPEWISTAPGWNRAPDFDSPKGRIPHDKSTAVCLYTAMKMWWTALGTLIQSSPGKSVESIAEDGKSVAEEIRKLRVKGISGLVNFVPGGWSFRHIAISVFQKEATREVFLLYNRSSDSLVDAAEDKHIVWMGNKNSLPPEMKCFADECEKQKRILTLIISLIAFGVLIAAITAGFMLTFIYKRIQEKKAIANWKINWSDVSKVEDNTSLHNSVERGKSVATVQSQQGIAPSGWYRGRLITVKFLKRDSLNIFDKILYKELQQMLYVKHENVNEFVGVCVDAPNVCYVMAYAEKGSLQDILADPQNEIDWDFRMSLAIDIVKGMSYLHTTAVGAHGHLTSGNCVVDERWVCKITDYGLQLFRCLDKSPRPMTELLWTAPEILHMKEEQMERVYGTKPGDVYSFGIIISELLTRELPYNEGMGTVPMEELLAKIKLSFEPPYRPTLPDMEDSFAGNWIELAKKCWKSNPSKRPPFRTITTILNITSSGRFTNVLERMQNVLEESVDRATVELKHVIQKRESMIRTSVPGTFANAIIASEEIEPQLLDSVTLCLCDTGGIYKATKKLSPDMVVKVMEHLYKRYDQIIMENGAFEVSTWGSKDTMLLTGGLESNPSMGPVEMCIMALDLMSLTRTFAHPSIKDGILKTKITLHTGPAFTTVLGKQMPQFCVFGESVQAIVDLHTFSKFMTIRVSREIRDVLMEKGHFKMLEAGKVDISDRPPMMTYFVIEMDGYVKPLPPLEGFALKNQSSSRQSSSKQRKLKSS